jgi:thioredoxin reductase
LPAGRCSGGLLHFSYNSPVDSPQVFDCIIIGGGAAGLSAAMVLARAHRMAALIDNRRQSNLATLEAHSVFSRDKVAPAELYDTVRDQLRSYISVVQIEDTALTVTGGAGVPACDPCFSVTLAGGDVLHARKLLLAQGVDYELPDIPGIHDLWGRKAFHCPYCDGWEMTDKRLLAIGSEKWREGMSGTLPNWTRCLTWATPEQVASLSDSQAGVWAALRDTVSVDWQQPPIAEAKAEVTGEGSAAAPAPETTSTARDRQVEFDRVIVQTSCNCRDGIADSLGVQRNEKGQVIKDENGRTNVEGVYVAGDQADEANYVNVAAAAGTLAGVAINADLD